MYYWIKERNNPQFDKPYFVAYGQMKAREARKLENAIYGSNIMRKFRTKKAYDQTLEKLKEDGYSVKNIVSDN